MSELLKHLKTIAILSIPAWGIFLPIITLRALPHSFADVIVKILNRFGFGYIIPVSLIVYGYSPIYKAM